MRKYIKIKYIIFTIAITAVLSYGLFPLTACAWGDNGGGRPSYTEEEIDNGAIGATEISDGENYKESDNYPGIIVFNSISDSAIGNEKNFVGTRECTIQANGRCNAATKETIWNANEITVKDGQTYIIRAYIHNNNPNGEDAVAENTMVSFIVPTDSAKEIEVNGIISSSNATPSKYWDDVVFKSERLFHLEYVYGSALFTNNGIGKGGLSIGDEVVTNAANGGMLIGYDKLDGRIPGCYQYDSFVTIQVKAVFDDFMAKTQVRHAGDKEWQDTITANVGDKVEFQIEYQNISDEWQNNVVIRNILPPNLSYISGSTKIKNSSHPNGATVNEDHIIDDGIQVGDYGPDANVYVIFTAEVVDDSLANGQNTLINWGRASVNGEKLLKDDAKVIVQKRPKDFITKIILLSAGILICLFCLMLLIYKIIKFNRRK